MSWSKPYRCFRCKEVYTIPTDISENDIVTIIDNNTINKSELKSILEYLDENTSDKNVNSIHMFNRHILTQLNLPDWVISFMGITN